MSLRRIFLPLVRNPTMAEFQTELDTELYRPVEFFTMKFRLATSLEQSKLNCVFVLADYGRLMYMKGFLRLLADSGIPQTL